MPSETAISALPPTQNVVTYSYVDLTVTISIILAFAAIIVPAIVSVMNNRKEIKLKQLELERDQFENVMHHKRDMFEKFLYEAGQAIGAPLDDHMETYSPSYFVALASAPRNIRNQMEEVNEFITKRDFESAAIELELASGEINNYLETMKIQDKPKRHILDKFYSLVRRNGR